MAYLDFVLQTTDNIYPEGDPDRFISEHTGIIRLQRERTDKVSRVGKVHAYRIHATLAHRHQLSLYFVCDSHSQWMLELYDMLYDIDEEDFKGPINYQFETLWPDCLVIDYVAVHPKLRGRKLGQLAVRKMVDIVGGGCGLTVCSIGPLYLDSRGQRRVPASWLRQPETPEEEKAAYRKLRGYFRQMGFRRIRRTHLYGLSMAGGAPTLENLCGVPPCEDV